MITDGRADDTLEVEDGAETEKVSHNQVDGGCIFKDPGNCWGAITNGVRQSESDLLGDKGCQFQVRVCDPPFLVVISDQIHYYV